MVYDNTNEIDSRQVLKGNQANFFLILSLVIMIQLSQHKTRALHAYVLTFVALWLYKECKTLHN